jgi:hypothetical protein
MQFLWLKSSAIFIIISNNAILSLEKLLSFWHPLFTNKEKNDCRAEILKGRIFHLLIPVIKNVSRSFLSGGSSELFAQSAERLIGKSRFWRSARAQCRIVCAGPLFE